jgi:ABC-type multidrug transport system ATPase subunit
MDTMTIELDNAASVDLDIDGSYRIEGSTLHVETRDGARALTGVLHQLESQGHDVVEVRTERSKLEDIFVHLTGDDDA